MMALGGSTNAVIHLTAIAGRRGIQLPLDLFDRMSRETPFITNLRPSGTFHMEQLFEAGGVPAVLKELARGGLLHLDEPTDHRPDPRRAAGARAATGPNAASGSGWCGPERIVFSLDAAAGSRRAASPSCAATWRRDGAVIKQTAVSPQLMRHRGQALVFTSTTDLRRAHRRSRARRHAGQRPGAAERRTARRAGHARSRRPADSEEAAGRRACATWCASRMRA